VFGFDKMSEAPQLCPPYPLVSQNW